MPTKTTTVLAYISPALMTMVLGFCVYLVQEIHEIRLHQADAAKYIVQLDNIDEKLKDHEIRLRMLEKK